MSPEAALFILIVMAYGIGFFCGVMAERSTQAPEDSPEAIAARRKADAIVALADTLKRIEEKLT